MAIKPLVGVSHTTGITHVAVPVQRPWYNNTTVTVYKQACGMSRRQTAYIYLAEDQDTPVTCKRCSAKL